MTPTLLTSGYAQHRVPEALADALASADVAWVVDVRALPRSRRPGFSKTGLAAALARAGVGYAHERALGNPARDLWRAGERAEGERRYRAHLAGPGAPALAALAAAVPEARICLLCLEADPADCHRTLVAAALRARLPGLRIVHL